MVSFVSDPAEKPATPPSVSKNRELKIGPGFRRRRLGVVSREVGRVHRSPSSAVNGWGVGVGATGSGLGARLGIGGNSGTADPRDSSTFSVCSKTGAVGGRCAGPR